MRPGVRRASRATQGCTPAHGDCGVEAVQDGHHQIQQHAHDGGAAVLQVLLQALLPIASLDDIEVQLQEGSREGGARSVAG